MAVEEDRAKFAKGAETKASDVQLDEVACEVLKGDVKGRERGDEEGEKILIAVGHEDVKRGGLREDGKWGRDVVPQIGLDAGNGEIEDDRSDKVGFVVDGLRVQEDEVVGYGDGKVGPNQRL